MGRVTLNAADAFKASIAARPLVKPGGSTTSITSRLLRLDDIGCALIRSVPLLAVGLWPPEASLGCSLPKPKLVLGAIAEARDSTETIWTEKRKVEWLNVLLFSLEAHARALLDLRTFETQVSVGV